MLSAFFLCFPGSASVAGTSLQDGAGGKTQVGNMFSYFTFIFVTVDITNVVTYMIYSYHNFGKRHTFWQNVYVEEKNTYVKMPFLTKVQIIFLKNADKMFLV